MKLHTLLALIFAFAALNAADLSKEAWKCKKLAPVCLWQDKNIKNGKRRPAITPFLVPGNTPRPAVLVIPGGAYRGVCWNTEGHPVARRFNKLGYHAFVLDYRTAPNRWPAPQQDAMRAMKIIRGNAKKWQVDPQRVYSCRFSAGGHLAGSLGTICDQVDASANDEYDKISHVPDGMILCYGVLVFEPWSHKGTQQALLGDDYVKIAAKYSLPPKINRNTPPAFLMHTIGDTGVSYRNSIEFANAMAKHKRPCQLYLCNWGHHGMLLGNNTLDVGKWSECAVNFLETVNRMKSDPEYIKRYTNRYQSKNND